MLSGRQKQPVRCRRVDWLRKKCIPCTKNQEPLVQDPDARANVSVGHGKAFEVIHVSNIPTRSCSMYKCFLRIRVLTSEGNLFNKSELLWLFSHEMLTGRKKFLRSALRSYVFVHLPRPLKYDIDSNSRKRVGGTDSFHVNIFSGIACTGKIK